MKLILVRHGQAIEREDFFHLKKDDALRPLVIKGKKRSIMMAKELKKWVGEVDMLVTSPYVRARQTAEIFRRVLCPKKAHQVTELIPSAPPMAFAQWLRGNAGLATSIVIVGHEPQLGLFATWALSGQMESFVELKKSGIIGLDVESLQEIRPGHADLKFLITPKMFD
jgi:phosphohistidine phosphatase